MRIPHWNYLSWARDRFGAVRALSSYPLRGIAKVDGVYLRPGTSDQDVYDSVFGRHEYDIDIDEPQLIVDAGAHIGLASVFLARKYPRAKIIALEPEPGNFAMLLRNTRGLNVTCMQAGLWSRDTYLRIENADAQNWSFRVVEDIDGPIEAWSVSRLIERYGYIDCLKLDIEGSEKTVLEHSKAWIGTVHTLIVELHDRFMPGCTKALQEAIRGLPFRHQQSGENVVLTRHSPA